MDKPAGDFQRGGSLFMPTSDIQRTPKHSWTSDRHQKQASAKAYPTAFGNGVLVISLLMELSIDNENCSFVKAGHIYASYVAT